MCCQRPKRITPGSSLAIARGCFGRKSLSIRFSAPGPEMRIVATAERPGAVSRATTVGDSADMALGQCRKRHALQNQMRYVNGARRYQACHTRRGAPG